MQESVYAIDVVYMKEGKTLNIKEWLNRAIKTEKEIEALELQKEHIRKFVFSDMSLNYRTLFKEYLDYENKINSEIDKMFETRKEIFNVICEIPDPRSRQLLQLRYLCNSDYTWEKIADKMKYDLRWIHRRLHPQALKDAEAAREKLGYE